MNRAFAAGVGLVVAAVGCQAPPKLVEPFPEPSRASGAWVVLEDRRPDWEKAPFAGPVFSLYRFSRVSPNPWVRLLRATEAVVAELPEKPERADVVVSSFRLVTKEANPVSAPRDANGNAIEPGGTTAGLSQQSVVALGFATIDKALPATKAGPGAVTKAGNPFAPKPPAEGLVAATDDQPGGPLEGLPPGATCSLRGAIRLTYPGGGVKDVPFDVLAGRPNQTGSAYWGETLEEVTTLAMIQFTRQVRERVGLPPQN